MKKILPNNLLAIFILFVFLLVFSSSSLLAQTPAERYPMFKPLPDKIESSDNPVTKEKVELGRRLYFDTSFSKSGTISCNTCHQLDKFGVDNLAVSPGHDGSTGERNSPSVFNAAIHNAQFWDGRAKDVEEQALGPVLNPIEMGLASGDEVIEIIKSNPEYVKLFKAAFSGDSSVITFENFGRAIGAYERTLLTPSRFDDFLKGDEDALTDDEEKGLKTFIRYGCTTCHNGAGVGGSMYQKLGLIKPYPTKDLGRYEVTKNDTDKYMFKVPSLRNVEKTGPYFHDGSIKTLEEAIKIMGEYQLGNIPSDEEIKSIVTFLKTLNGRVPQNASKPEDASKKPTP